MKQKRPCPFCGGTEVSMMWSQTSSHRTANVRCDHCAAEGSHMTDLPNTDGEFEKTKRQLKADAWAAWNGKHQ